MDAISANELCTLTQLEYTGAKAAVAKSSIFLNHFYHHALLTNLRDSFSK
jgi:hypothetical protein